MYTSEFTSATQTGAGDAGAGTARLAGEAAEKYVASLQSDELVAVEEVLPVDVVDACRLRLVDLVELVLKDRWRLFRILRDPAAAAELLPRLLTIALAGFVLFGVAMSLVLTVSGRWPSLVALATWVDGGWEAPLTFAAIDSSHIAPWINGEAIALVAAYAFGLVAASGVALPSLYFYCLLAGVKMSWLDVVVHAVKAKAVSAVALVGILPIYVALAMGVVIFGGGELLLGPTLLLGLLLPFIAGVWGTVSLYQGFSQLCDTMPPAWAKRRECFLRRLVLSWAACYTAIMPVMVYSLWEVMSRG